MNYKLVFTLTNGDKHEFTVDIPDGSGGGGGGSNPYIVVTNPSSGAAPAIGNGNGNVVIGSGAGEKENKPTKDGIVVIGASSKAKDNRSVAIGSSSLTGNSDSVAIGTSATANGKYGVAVGSDATAQASYSTAVGMGSKAESMRSVAIGNESQATHLRSIALGYGSKTYRDYSLSVGTEEILKGITCVDVAKKDTDVPNWGQVKDLVNTIETPDNTLVREIVSGDISWNYEDAPESGYAAGKLGSGCYLKFQVKFPDVKPGVTNFVPVVALSRAPCDKDGVIIPHQLYVFPVTATNTSTPKAQATVIMESIPTHTIDPKTLKIVPVGRLVVSFTPGIPEIPIVPPGGNQPGSELSYHAEAMVYSKDVV